MFMFEGDDLDNNAYFAGTVRDSTYSNNLGVKCFWLNLDEEKNVANFVPGTEIDL